MEAARKRGAAKNVVASSVWDGRMKNGEVKSGIKSFNADENSEGAAAAGGGGKGRVNRNQSGGVSGKRTTRKSQSVEGNERSPIQLRKSKSESQRFSDDSRKELSGSVDGIEKSPSQLRKTRSETHRVPDESRKELRVSVDEIEKSPDQGSDTGSETQRVPDESSEELSVSVDLIEKSADQVSKTRSETHIISDDSQELSVSVDGIEKSPHQVSQTRSETHIISDESCKELGVSDLGIEESPTQLRQTGSDSERVSEETPKELSICGENAISTSSSNVSQISSPQRLKVDDDVIDADEEEEEEEEDGEDEEDIEMEIETKSYDDKEVDIPEQQPNNIAEQKKLEKVVHEEKVLKQDNISEQKLKKVVDEEKVHQIHEKPVPISANMNKKPAPVHRTIIGHDIRNPEKAIVEQKKAHHMHKKSVPISANLNKQRPFFTGYRANNQDLNKPPPIAVPEVFDRIPGSQNKFQNIVDLVMWRDVSRSAFVFGIGSFILISSSYTKDVNFSLISVFSYLGLVYLGVVFLYKSILCRGSIDFNDSNEIYVVGEEEAIWILRLILPYLNEFLLKLRGLFSGDPATTLKLAVLLFVLARCGSFITVWKMTKLGFFGVFTVPKVCSSYSTQLTGYGKFWIRRFRDAWDSCTHKKAVAAAIFTLLWNLSSVVARIWAVFMLVVAVRYYQQSLISEDWEEEVGGGGGEDSNWRVGDWGQSQEPGGPTLVELVKEKKGS